MDISLRSDLHAVCSILWAAATGDVPFPAMGASFVSSMHAKRQLVEAIPARPASMPTPLYDVLARALQPRAEDRFASAHDFADALEALVQDAEVFASTHLRPTVPAPRPRREVQQPTSTPKPEPAPAIEEKPASRWPWIGGAVAVAAALGIAGLIYLQPEPIPPAPAASSPAAPPASGPAAATVSSAAIPTSPSGPKVSDLVPGPRHSCARIEGGKLACWGANEKGQLGDGTTRGRSRPAYVQGVEDVAEVGVGDEHTCARSSDGRVWCWGGNEHGELGDDTQTLRAAPMLIKQLPAVERIFVAGCQTWALTQAGETWGWGCQDRAEDLTMSSPQRHPKLDGAKDLLSVALDGAGMACALFDSRPAACWQWGATSGGVRSQALDGMEDLAALALAKDHGCARLTDGKVRCWGDNGAGEVGDGTRAGRTTPVELANAKDVVEVVVGPGYGCALQRGGAVLCWGRNDRHQTGRAGTEDQLVPTAVPGIAKAKHIATDQGRTCAVVEDGRVGCWGAGIDAKDGQPVWMDAMRGAAAIRSSGRGVLCTIGASGGAACLGDDENGQLGAGRAIQRTQPGRVVGLENVERIWAAARNACALDKAKQLWCWGSNAWAAFAPDAGTQSRPVLIGRGVQDVALGTRGLYTLVSDEEGKVAVKAGGSLLSDLGAGASAPHAYPQSVPSLDHAIQLAVGTRHGCARMDDGTVACWGDNTSGQLGDGSPRSRTKPGAALLEGDVEQVACGGFHTCALRKSGGLLCWGSNRNGQAGPGPTWTCNSGGRAFPCVRKPRRVIGVQNAKAVAAGQWHTCTLLQSGKVSCWGANHVGQLGDGTTDDRPTPKDVRDISNAVQLTASEQHTCVLVGSGAVWCWGDDGFGELGRSAKDKCGSAKEPCGTTPGPVEGLTDAAGVAAGWEFTCALKKDGTVWCWGNNQRGTLGDGEPLVRNDAAPVQW